MRWPDDYPSRSPGILTFAPQQSALIVVDMQNAYASRGGYLISPALTSPLPGRLSTILHTAVAAAAPRVC